MMCELLEAIEIGGKKYRINADFRNILRIFEAFNDNELTEYEKMIVCIQRLYCEKLPKNILEEAIKKAYWFCDGGDIPKSEPENFKTLDWAHDASIIFPAVSRAAGVVQIRAVPFLHWWTFLGLFGEIGDGLFSTVMHIRQKLAKRKKLEKWEQEFYEKNKSLVTIRTAQEQAEIDETESFLITII